jgi:hypothetical protein
MIAAQIKDQTKNFHKPLGWDNETDGHCGDLSVKIVQHGRLPYHLSWWEPTVEELKLLAEGGRVELNCVGVQPPVALSVVPNN